MAVQESGLDGDVTRYVAAAAQAAAAGDWLEAERRWRKVIELSPGHPQALYSLGVHAYRRGDWAAAMEHLQAARRAAPTDPMIVLSIAMVRQAMGDLDGEWQAIGAALTLDPYFLPGLLAKAEFQQARGRRHAAAAIYRDALLAAPPEPQWPAPLRRRLEQARQAIDLDATELATHLQQAVAPARTALNAGSIAKWDEAVAIASGRSRPYPSQSNRLLVPRLPAHTFYDEALFPWIEALQAHTDEIEAELWAALSADAENFTPYVAYAPDQPVNQWRQLNHSRAWSSYPLWAHGRPVEENLARCPATAAALRTVDAAVIDGMCPNAMFSVLAPHTAIPPHNGETNARLVAHLPLVVPERCRFRVGYDWREWQRGKVLVFDDSIEHEARNDSDEVRVVLIFDVWNPLLAPAERTMVQAMERALVDYHTN
jgi:aspartyl/asparaginyl beta-hydroxylase (cupin superfamily)